MLGLFALVVAASCAQGASETQPNGGAGGTAAHGAGGGHNGGGGSGANPAGGSGPGGGGPGGTSPGGGSPGGAGGAAGGSGGAGQGGSGCTGPDGTGSGPCEFPSVDAAVNDVMVQLTGCGVLSDCPLTTFPGSTTDEICQSWFAAVTAELRAQGYCAGQHIVGSTDEIAVSNTGCDGKWYGYHICNYGGPKVVWNPGARRGWWAIDPGYCP